MAVSRAVGSVVGTLAGRIMKQSGSGIANRIAARNIAKSGPINFQAEALKEIADLTPASREKIAWFVQSGDFEQLTLRLSVAVSTQKKKDLETLRRSLNESMRLYRTVPEKHLQAVSDALFDDLQAAVVSKLTALSAEGKLSLTTAKVASAQAAAATRNCDLLARLDDLRAHDDFHRVFSRQVSLIESKVRPPQIDTGSRISIDRMYVQATLLEEGDSNQGDVSSTSLAPKDIFDIYPRVVVLGDPGGGKSTLATKLCVDLARGRNKGSAAKVPFKIVMRDYAKYFQNSRTSIVEYLRLICAALYSTPAPQGSIEYLLLNSRAAVIFDGLDELTNTALRQDMVSAVEAFALAYPGTPIMVTSRKVGYDLSPLDSELFETLTLGSFSYEQRRTYVQNWFSLMRSGSQQEKHRLSSDFLGELSHAHDLSSNPLMLGLMCALYRGAGYIPRNRPELYRRCSEFLFERWDSSRGILLEKPFERGIQNAMFALALKLIQSPEGASGLTEKQLVQFTTSHLHDRHYEDFDAAQSAARQFVEYCRGRAWVLTDVGTDLAGNNLYAFTHRTFLEYFAARQIVRECNTVESMVDILYPNLRVQEWDVVAQLAIQTLDERLLDGSNETMLSLIEKSQSETERGPRIAVASFCARSVEFMDLRPLVLRSITDNYVRTLHDIAGLKERERVSLTGAASGLLRCPPELRPVIADQLHIVISQSQDKSGVLAFALGLTLQGDRHEHHKSYWEDVENQIIEDFSVEIGELSRSTPWFAMRLYQKGKCSLRQVIEWHGVGALFGDQNYDLIGAFGRENTFTFITYGGRAFRSLPSDAEVDPGALQEWRRDVSELIEVLISSPTPWAERLWMHSWVHDESKMIPENSDELFLRILNVMVGGERILDLVAGGRRRFTGSQCGSVYRAIARARRRQSSEGQLREALKGFSEERVDFVAKWCASEISLLVTSPF